MFRRFYYLLASSGLSLNRYVGITARYTICDVLSAAPAFCNVAISAILPNLLDIRPSRLLVIYFNRPRPAISLPSCDFRVFAALPFFVIVFRVLNFPMYLLFYLGGFLFLLFQYRPD